MKQTSQVRPVLAGDFLPSKFICAAVTFSFALLLLFASHSFGQGLALAGAKKFASPQDAAEALVAATETFNEGTLPNIGIDTRKSHFLRTRSWTPLPSAPSTMPQSIL